VVRRVALRPKAEPESGRDAEAGLVRWTKALARWTAALSIFTALLFGVTGVLGYLTIADARRNADEQTANTQKSYALTRDAMIATSRAWISPTNVQLPAGRLVKDQPFVVEIDYTNTGREPATEALLSYTVFLAANPGSGLDQVNKAQASCFGSAATGADVVYPAFGLGNNTASATLSLPASFATDQAASGSQTLFVTGCFTYKSFAILRHSAFCYYYDAALSKPERLNICAAGEAAD